MATLERRIEELEKRRRKPRIAVVNQAVDGTWPDDPPGATLIIRIRRFGGALDDSAEAPPAHQ